MPGFLTQIRQETGADNPRFGGGGTYVDNDAMAAKEVVFGITRVDWDGDNTWEGTPRPRWVLDVIPWYDGDSLPGKADANGRPTQIEAGRVTLASHRNRDAMLEGLQQRLEELQQDDPDYVEGPGVLVRIRIPGGRSGRYLDLCEWDPDADGGRGAPAGVLANTEPVSEEEPPRRPSARQAPARRAVDSRPAASTPPAPAPPASPRRRPASAETGSARQPEPASGFEAADGAESGEGEKAIEPVSASAPASAGNGHAFGVEPADLELVSRVLGMTDVYTARELAEEYVLADDQSFPTVSRWLEDHGVGRAGRGRPTNDQRRAYEVAKRCFERGVGEKWADKTAADSDILPTTAQEAAEEAAQVRTASRQVQPASVPENALAADEQKRPAEAPARPQDKAAWMPPDERERRGRGQPAGATEHVYSPGDVGDSVDVCPGCRVVVTGRALPSGGGQFSIMHKCDGDGVTRPLLARNVRKG